MKVCDVGAIILAVMAGAAAPAAAQRAPAADTVALSLAAALRRGLAESEEVRLSRSQVATAQAQLREVRSGLYPTIGFDLNYLRTIRSPFRLGSPGAYPDSLRFRPDTTAPIGVRVRYIEDNADLAALETLSGLFSGFPIGRANTYIGRFTVRQTVFNSSVFEGVRASREFLALADAQATEQEAELRLQITEAYYDAVLASRLAGIVDASARQLDAQLAQTRLVRQAGNASDLDVLRVLVDRQNLEPQRVAALNALDLALLNVKRLINLPLETPLVLTDSLAIAGFRPVPEAVVAELVAAAEGRRASIAAAERQSALMERRLSAVRSTWLPTVVLTANFGRQALPTDILPSGADWNDDWNVGLGVQVPVFNGGQRAARVRQAQEELRRAELTLARTREGVAMDVSRQAGELRRAEALVVARAQTTAQAERVYQLTDLSYRQGITTYLELSSARLALNQASTNEVQALHNYYVALVRLQRAAGAPVTVAGAHQ